MVTVLNIAIHQLGTQVAVTQYMYWSELLSGISGIKGRMRVLTLSMLRLLSSKAQEGKYFFQNHLNPIMLVLIG